MEYLLNPDLPVLPAKRDAWRGNPIRNGEFQYVQREFRPEWNKLLRWFLSRNPQRAEKKADTWRPPVATETSYLADRERDYIVWLGHACFLIQLGGVRLLTDPNFIDTFYLRRLVKPVFSLAQLRGIDYVLLSHDHRDHVDAASLKTILAHNRVRKILAPLRLSRVIGSWVGSTPVEEAAWYQTFRTGAGAPEVSLLPTRHWSRRGLTDFNRVLWGAFHIRSGEHGIYFGGDSAKTEYWAEAGTLFPGTDYALLGIGAYKPSYMMEEVHAAPEEALWGFRQMRARYFWPMHYGTYDLSDEPIGEPYRRVHQLCRDAGLSDRLLTPGIGEVVYL
jgi:L-ascorbate metabolism protein UlaG (beta-lactamase superfamily)